MGKLKTEETNYPVYLLQVTCFLSYKDLLPFQDVGLNYLAAASNANNNNYFHNGSKTFIIPLCNLFYKRHGLVKSVIPNKT